MLVIRDEQMSVLAASSLQGFTQRARIHLRRTFPEQLQHTSNAGLELEITGAVAAAGRFGIVSERDCCRYLHVCVIAGWHFPEDPGSAWMVETLSDHAVTDPSMRLDLLIARWRHRRHVEERNRAVAARFGLE